MRFRLLGKCSIHLLEGLNCGVEPVEGVRPCFEWEHVSAHVVDGLAGELLKLVGMVCIEQQAHGGEIAAYCTRRSAPDIGPDDLSVAEEAH